MSSPANLEAQRLRLIRLAQSASLPVREVLRLARDDLDTLPDYNDDTVLAFARALLVRSGREAGAVPLGWSEARQCSGCGPVWLWFGAPARVLACPWCFNRKAGRPVPLPQP